MSWNFWQSCLRLISDLVRNHFPSPDNRTGPFNQLITVYDKGVPSFLRSARSLGICTQPFKDQVGNVKGIYLPSLLCTCSANTFSICSFSVLFLQFLPFIRFKAPYLIGQRVISLPQASSLQSSLAHITADRQILLRGSVQANSSSPGPFSLERRPCQTRRAIPCAGFVL